VKRPRPRPCAGIRSRRPAVCVSISGWEAASTAKFLSSNAQIQSKNSGLSRQRRHSRVSNTKTADLLDTAHSKAPRHWNQRGRLSPALVNRRAGKWPVFTEKVQRSIPRELYVNDHWSVVCGRHDCLERKLSASKPITQISSSCIARFGPEL